MRRILRGGTAFVLYFFVCIWITQPVPAAAPAASSEGLLLRPIVDHSPPSNALDIDRTATVSVTFDSDMDAASLNASTFIVIGALSGRHAGVIGYNATSRTAEFTPQTPFAIGEVVSVTLTNAIRFAGGQPIDSAYVWTFTARAEGGTGTFDLGPSLPISTVSYDIAVGDFNGDQLFDLVTANFDSNSISVIFNNGDSTLILDSSYAAGAGAMAVCTGDYDADGATDIAVGGNSSGDVTIFLNTGGGIFAPEAPVTVGSGPRDLISFDADGDGDLDLAVTNFASKSMSVLLNDGLGHFAQDSIYSIDRKIFFLGAADLDLDGSLDLVTAGSDNDSAYVFLNHGDGTFDSAATYSSGAHPRGTAVADFNGDGFADMATGNDVPRNISIFLNHGDGTFGDEAIYSTGDYGPFVLTAGDLDADGDIDIATSDGGYGTTSIMINDGNGAFALDRAYQSAVTSYGIAQADMDGDGDLDIAIAADNPKDVRILLNKDRHAVDSTQPHSFAESAALSDSIVVFFRAPVNQASLTDSAIVVRSRARGLVSGEINLSGPTVAVFKPDQPFVPGDRISVTVTTNLEVISEDRLITSYSWRFTTAVTGGIGAFQASRQSAVDVSPQAMCVADLNGDGLQDVATVATDRNLISLLVNNGDSTFTRDTAGAVDRLPFDIAAADLDDDGDIDLVTACLGDSSVVVCYNDSTGRCGYTSRFAEGVRTSSVAVADFDEDGHPDIAAAKVYSESTYVYINNGQGGFSAPGAAYYMKGMPYKITAVDIDNDGDEDLVSSIYSDHHYVSILFNNGFGEFYNSETAEAYPSDSGAFADSSHSVYAGDLNGDGFADLAVGNVRLDNISVLFNDGAGTFPSVVTYEGISQPHSIFGGDFDGDGDVDLAVADRSVAGYATVMENNGDGTFSDIHDYAVGSMANTVVGADIDGDGDMDLLTSDGDADDVSLLLNRDSAYVMPLPIPETVPLGDSCLMQVKVLGDPDEVILHYRRGGETAWIDTVMQSADTVYQCQIANDLTGLRSTAYYFEIFQLESAMTLPAVDATTKPFNIRAELSDALTPGLRDSAYQIIGFPFDVNPGSPSAVFEDDFGPYNAMNWRMGRWNPDAVPPGYDEYPVLDSIRRGEGYWLYSRVGAHLDASGLSAIPDTVINDTAYARIDLRYKWNQIATPFPFAVSWSHRRPNSEIDAVVNAYTATDTGNYYYTTDTLLPFQGYFLYCNDSSTTPLFLPYIRAGLLPTVALLPTAPRYDFWQAQLGLESDGAADAANVFGVRPRAVEGPDEYDSHEPPLPPGKYVSLSFERSNAEGTTELLSSDYRKPGSEWTFDLLVRGNSGTPARLRLADTRLLPPEYVVVLVDAATGNTYRLPRSGSLNLPRTPTVEGVRYQMIVGDEEYIDSYNGSSAGLPDRFCLYQNHPNPFNPATTIKFDLPAPTHARLDIFNILGQRVVTLLDRTMPAGSHTVTWDGRDGDGRAVASGVYFYRLRTGTDVARRKMILVK